MQAGSWIIMNTPTPFHNTNNSNEQCQVQCFAGLLLLDQYLAQEKRNETHDQHEAAPAPAGTRHTKLSQDMETCIAAMMPALHACKS
jgi:hypothetical protein